MADADIDKEQQMVDIENNITLRPVIWMQIFVAFLKAESKQNNMAMSVTKTELILVFLSYQRVMINQSFTE